LLALTRKTDYALVALAELARGGGQQASARDLSERSGVPVRMLTNVLNQLTHQGFVVSSRGSNGGFRLAKEPGDISVAALIEAIEGPMRLALCCSEGSASASAESECRIESTCHIKEPMQRLHAKLRHFLEQITLRDLVGDTENARKRLHIVANVSGCGCSTDHRKRTKTGESLAKGEIST